MDNPATCPKMCVKISLPRLNTITSLPIMSSGSKVSCVGWQNLYFEWAYPISGNIILMPVSWCCLFDKEMGVNISHASNMFFLRKANTNWQRVGMNPVEILAAPSCARNVHSNGSERFLYTCGSKP